MAKNLPTDHHYIPRFYLRRWHSEPTGKLVEFSRPREAVLTKDVTAAATGFGDRLYTLRGYEDELAQQFEMDYLAKIDGLASDALDHLERHGGTAGWTTRSRSAWSRFILGLLLRTPEDIARLRERWPQYLWKTDPAAEEQYRISASSDDPDSLAGFIRSQPQTFFEKTQFQILGELIDHRHVGARINNMIWDVIDFPDDTPSLLTSDRPVVMTDTFNHPNAHIALSIGPRRLFVAARSGHVLSNLRRLRYRKELARSMNRSVVGQAVRYVYSIDRAQLAFIAKHFGKRPQSRILDRIMAP